MENLINIKKGDELDHPSRGKGLVLGRSMRTITVKWKHSTQTITFHRKPTEILITDF